MRLNIFNPWKEFGNYFGRSLEYQTSKVKEANNLYVTYIRDAKSNATITKAYGSSQEISQQNVLKILKSIGSEDVWNAIQTGQPIVKSQTQAPVQKPNDDRKIDWRDGAHHRYRAQKKIVGEAVQDKPRNFVAKNARKVNKAGPMKDKKNDYTRNPKHKSKIHERE